MTLLTPAMVFRKWVTDGVPESGTHDPLKAEIVQLLDSLFGVTRGGWVVALTKADLLAVTPADETDGGVVLDDPDPALNGYYGRDAAAWVQGRGLPDTLAFVTLGGAANTQTGTFATGVDPANILEFIATPNLTNTGPMTLSHGGETPKPVLNYAGNAMSAGEWATFVRYRDDGLGNYRLTIDANSAAVASAAATVASTKADEAAASAALSGPTGVYEGTFTGDGTTTTFVMTVAPSSVAHVWVAVDGILQPPGSYSIDTTDLIFTEAPPEELDAGGTAVANISYRIVSIADGELVPPDLSVTTSKLGPLAVTTAKLAASAVTYAKMQDVSATDKLLGRSTAGAGVVEEIPCTAAGRALLDDADAAAQRTTLGAQQAAQFVDVELSVAQSIPDDTYDLVDWDVENSDVSGLYSAGTSRVTLTRDGLVQLSANLLILGGTLTVDNNALLELRLNGTAIKGGRTMVAITGNVTIPLNTQFMASSGDYLEIYSKVKGTSLTISSGADSWLNLTIL